YRALNGGVVGATGGVGRITDGGVGMVKGTGTTNARRRARLCAHPNPDDPLHEMLIVLDRGTYVRPHRHAGKSESFHVIEGELDVVLFAYDGPVRDVIRNGSYGTVRDVYAPLIAK